MDDYFELNGDSGGYLNLRGPNKSCLQAMLDMGWTQQQIADRWFQISGVSVARSTIGMAIARYGLKSVNYTWPTNKARLAYRSISNMCSILGRWTPSQWPHLNWCGSRALATRLRAS